MLKLIMVWPYSLTCTNVLHEEWNFSWLNHFSLTGFDYKSLLHFQFIIYFLSIYLSSSQLIFVGRFYLSVILLWKEVVPSAFEVYNDSSWLITYSEEQNVVFLLLIFDRETRLKQCDKVWIGKFACYRNAGDGCVTLGNIIIDKTSQDYGLMVWNMYMGLPLVVKFVLHAASPNAI